MNIYHRPSATKINTHGRFRYTMCGRTIDTERSRGHKIADESITSVTCDKCNDADVHPRRGLR